MKRFHRSFALSSGSPLRLLGFAALLVLATLAIALVVALLTFSRVNPNIPGVVHAASYSVNSTSDTNDGSCSPAHCTLREAILAANPNAGADVITFDPLIFPPASPSVIALGSDLPTLRDDKITIDGTGAGVIIDGQGHRFNGILAINSGEHSIRNLEFRGFHTAINLNTNSNYNNVNNIRLRNSRGLGIFLVGDNNNIQDNIIDDAYQGLWSLGANNNIQRNTLTNIGTAGGISISGQNNSVNGNSVSLRIVPNFVTSGISIAADNTSIYQNRVSNTSRAIVIHGSNNSVSDNILDNNLVGVEISPSNSDAENNSVVANTSSGVLAGPVPGTAIPSAGIVIIGLSSFQVRYNSIWRNIVTGHYAGVTIDGRFGGVIEENEVIENTIYQNTAGGIQLLCDHAEPCTNRRNRLSRNSLESNGGLGIDLSWSEFLTDSLGTGDGVTANDTNDSDTGPNDLLNFPSISSATILSVQGTACALCTIDVFKSAPDGSGYGEGHLFLASGAADATGDFNIGLVGLVPGDLITLTAIDSVGNTSEFSGNASVQDASTPAERLVNKHLPILYVFPDDYQPEEVQIMLNQLGRTNYTTRLIESRLGRDREILQDPTAEDLAANPEGNNYIDIEGVEPIPGDRAAYRHIYVSLSDSYDPIIYAQIRGPVTPAGLAVDYWIFYFFNDFRNVHEGDWERIRIIFPAGVDTAEEALLSTPAAIFVTQHAGVSFQKTFSLNLPKSFQIPRLNLIKNF